MGLNSWTVCAAVPSPVKLTVVRNTWMQTKAETAPELSVTSLKLMWLMPEATGHGWWPKRESQLQSFLFFPTPRLRPTWFEKTSRGLLSCRVRRGRSQEHLQLSLSSVRVAPQEELTRAAGEIFLRETFELLGEKKEQEAPCNKFSGMISWLKSSGLVGVARSRVWVKTATLR